MGISNPWTQQSAERVLERSKAKWVLRASNGKQSSEYMFVCVCMALDVFGVYLYVENCTIYAEI